MEKYLFPQGIERVLTDVSAQEALPWLFDLFGYKRAFIICSRTLNTKTDIVARIREALGERVVGLSDDVGDHAPILKFLAIARQAKDLKSDVLLTIGGGSVMDATKMIQVAISEDVYTKSELLDLQPKFDFIKFAFGEYRPVDVKPAAIRQIAVPTTLATAEWTPAATPVDEDTRLKARFIVPDGTPQAIVYDTGVLAETPTDLLLSTGIRGLDHAVNTYCSTEPNPFTSVLVERAIPLFFDNLPKLKRDRSNREALRASQLATWYTGMGQIAVPHGFSHMMVHVLGPYAGVRHSDAACVLMLAQARWIEAMDKHPLSRIAALLGRPDEKFSELLLGLLRRLELPTTLAELGIRQTLVEEMLPLAVAHPRVMKYNLRPILTEDDIRAVLLLGGPAL
ncbi:iron-containing alcohol dehydrogenase [Tardiphaga sp. 215_C5_N2_1]|uniref:iron-containing alcohol dehydrogenase n=1 Tax=Tardiphaga sp. 215_C5_N2_1 TaxID=3240774 RepID=UPI003F894DC7